MPAATDTAQRLFDRHAHLYDAVMGAAFRPAYRRVLDQLVNAAPHGATVLDVGAGPGRLAVALATHRPDLTVHAVDLSPDMVAVATGHVRDAGLGDRVHVHHADAARLPLADASVDLVVSTGSFHHWADVPGVLAGIRRVVRPDGRIWVYDLRPAPWGRLDAAVGSRVPRTGAGLALLRATVPVR